MKPSDWNKVENFARSEWQTDPSKAPKELVFPMDRLRSVSDVPIFILECFATSGHAEYSYHYIALAVDFYFKPGFLSPLEQFCFISLFSEFGGIGFYPNSDRTCSWHVDLRVSSPKVVWFGDENRNYIYDPLEFMEVLCQNS